MEAEGSNINWEKIPFSLKPFEGYAELDAINERKAYKLFDSGRRSESLDIIAKLLPEYEESEELGALTERYLTMLGQSIKKVEDDNAYLEALHRANRDFRSSNIMGEGQSDAAKKYAKRFHMLFYVHVLKSLKATRAPTTQTDNRSQAIKGATLFLSLADDAKEKVRIMNEIAFQHQLNKEPGKAVDIYVEIAKIVKGDQKPAYLNKAIDAQRILAQWPRNPPWSKDIPGDKSARKKLITLYQMALRKDGNNWQALAHIGLLQKNIGSMETAIQTWFPKLAAHDKDQNAALAAGLMLMHYNDQKKWKDLIILSQTILKHQIEPKHKDKTLDPNIFLADALFKGGNDAVQRKEQNLAIKYFRMFRNQFKNDKRLAEVLFKTGLAYNDVRDQKKFVMSMKAVITGFPKSPYEKEALRKGIALSKDESDKVYFLENFLKRYQQDSEALAMRDALAKLYLGLTMVNKAIAVYEVQEKDKRTKPEGKLAFNLRIIELAEKDENVKASLLAAERITKTPQVPAAPLAKAYAVFAKFHAQKTQWDRVEHYAKLIEKLDRRDKATVAAIAQVRYLVAVRNSLTPSPAPDPRTIKDPTKEMMNQASEYQGLKTHFDKVCELGQTEACLRAKKDLSTVAQRSYDNIQSINMAQAPDNKTLNEFVGRKKKILQSISNSIQRTAH